MATKFINVGKLIFAPTKTGEEITPLLDQNGAPTSARVGSRTVANPSTTVPQRLTQGKAPTICVSRLGLGCVKSPNFAPASRAANTATGSAFVGGKQVYWRTDGRMISTTLSSEDFDVATVEEKCRVTAYPLAYLHEPNSPDTKDFRQNFESEQATVVEYLRYSDSLYFDLFQQTPNYEVEFDCGPSEWAAAASGGNKNAEKPATKKKTTKKSILPWLSSDTESVPNDFSVASASKGKYLLPFNWGLVTDGSETYDFAADVPPLTFLEGYIDNPSYRSAVRQLCSVFSALVRKHKITETETGDLAKVFVDAGALYATSIMQNLILVGEPGTGKTMLAYALAATFGLPIAILRLNTRSEQDEMTTQVIVTDDGFRSSLAQLYWYTQHGGIFVFDDVSNADANLFFAIVGGLLETPFEYKVSQKVVKRSALSFMIATANIGTIGSAAMNEALLTRFGSHVLVEPMTAKDFKSTVLEVVKLQTGYNPPKQQAKAVIDYVYAVYTKTLNTVKDVDAELAGRLITTRSAIALAHKVFSDLADELPVDAAAYATETMANILYTSGNPDIQKAIAAAISSLPVPSFAI